MYSFFNYKRGNGNPEENDGKYGDMYENYYGGESRAEYGSERAPGAKDGGRGFPSPGANEPRRRGIRERDRGYGRPRGTPPGFIPERRRKTGARAIDPASLEPCVGRYVYLWPNNGQPFWTFLTYAGRRSVSGYRWTNLGWIYFGLDLRLIDGFYCA